MFVPKGSIDKNIIVSGNGVAPDRQQNIPWTNDGLAYWRISGSLRIDESTQPEVLDLLYLVALKQ